MSHRRSRTVRRPAILATALLTLCALGARAGSLDAPAAPTAPGSALFTLQDIYDRLEDGSAGAKRTGPFVEPTSGPTTGTMQTLDAIMGKLPALDDTKGAAAGDVPQGLTFWGLRSDGWGPQTGTADVTGTPLCSCDCTDCSIWNADDGGTRWCDNGNGTVTDLLGADPLAFGGAKTTGRCLVWLKDAGWGGKKPWRSDTVGDYDDAHTRAGLLKSGEGNLSDGSVVGDWRLPTLAELRALTTDPQGILSGAPGPFSVVDPMEPTAYWSSTSVADNTSKAWVLPLSDGDVYTSDKKIIDFYLWPVRGGQ